MTAKFFVDTTILVYARDSSDRRKQKRARSALQSLWSARIGRLSYQVLAEYFVVLLNRFNVEESKIISDIQDFESWNPCAINKEVFHLSLKIREHYKLSWWDCQIIASAEFSDCRYLLTEDLSTGAVYSTVKVLNPFETDLEELLN